jgi:hypothetical protein
VGLSVANLVLGTGSGRERRHAGGATSRCCCEKSDERSAYGGLVQKSKETVWGRAGRYLASAGVVAGGLLLLAGLVMMQNPDSVLDVKLLGSAVAALGTLAIVGGRAGLARARRRSVVSLEQALASDPRPPVLYLRSFEDDADGEGYAELPATRLGVSALMSLTTQEEEIGRAFAEEGPFVAIEEPRNQEAVLGAARARIGDDEWRAFVRDLIRRSRRIVVRAGFGDGLRWEIETVVAEAEPERVVLLIPFALGKYQAFVHSAGHLFPGGLPEFGWSFAQLPAFPGVVLFDARWAPSFVPLRVPLGPFLAVARALRRALRRRRPGRRPPPAIQRRPPLVAMFGVEREQTYKLAPPGREQRLQVVVRKATRRSGGVECRHVEVYVDGQRIGPRLLLEEPGGSRDVVLADRTTLRIQARARGLAIWHEGVPVVESRT